VRRHPGVLGRPFIPSPLAANRVFPNQPASFRRCNRRPQKSQASRLQYYWTGQEVALCAKRKWPLRPLPIARTLASSSRSADGAENLLDKDNGYMRTR
jgi:hypothetical protein